MQRLGWGGILIKMFLDYLYQLPNSTEGLDEILVETASAVSGFIPLLLLFTYSIVLFTGIGLQKARSGFADYSMWSVVASMSTLLVGLVLSVINGFMRLEWLATILFLTIASGGWFIWDRVNNP